jgi:hypothetical protein
LTLSSGSSGFGVAFGLILFPKHFLRLKSIALILDFLFSPAIFHGFVFISLLLNSRSFTFIRGPMGFYLRPSAKTCPACPGEPWGVPWICG